MFLDDQQIRSILALVLIASSGVGVFLIIKYFRKSGVHAKSHRIRGWRTLGLSGMFASLAISPWLSRNRPSRNLSDLAEIPFGIVDAELLGAIIGALFALLCFVISKYDPGAR